MKHQIKRTIIGLTSLVLAAGSIPAMDVVHAAGLPQGQAEEQAVTVSEVIIAETVSYVEPPSEGYSLATGYAMDLIANVKLSDGTLAAEDMADVEWKIVSKSGKKVRTHCKANKPLTEAEAESKLDQWGVTDKGSRKEQKEKLIRSRLRLYVPCGYKNMEELEIIAVSKADPTVQSKPCVMHVVKKDNYHSGQESYFQFSTGKKTGGKVGKAKESWDAEKASYQVKLPTVTTKNKWLKFEGWKKSPFPHRHDDTEDENKVYKAGTVIKDKPVVYGGFMGMKASWKDLRVKDALDVRYRLDDTKKTVTVQKILSQKQEYVSIPKTVTYKKKKYPVTSIKKDAFAGSAVKGIEIGKNIKTIEAGAFSGCKQMGVIEIQSAKIEKIGKNAFRGLGKDVTVICPKKCVKRYRTMLRKAGLSKSATVKGL